jgi:hypothetical protein
LQNPNDQRLNSPETSIESSTKVRILPDFSFVMKAVSLTNNNLHQNLCTSSQSSRNQLAFLTLHYLPSASSHRMQILTPNYFAYIKLHKQLVAHTAAFGLFPVAEIKIPLKFHEILLNSTIKV